jgi:hypothetical protein
LTPTRAAAVNTGPVQGRPQGLVLTAASTTARWRKTGAENHHHQALRSSRPSKGPLARPSKSVIVLSNYLDNHNGHPKPYVWTKTAAEIFSKVARAKQALESQH